MQENPTSSDIASHISALHAAWRAFIASESWNKMKLAMHKNIRKSGAVFNIGDEVFYKWDDRLIWKGPRRVLSQDGLVAFIWHNSHYIRAHFCRVQLTNPSLDNNNLSQASNAIPLAQTNAPPSLDIPKPQPLTDTAVDTDNEYENIADSTSANECGNNNISDEDKKENSTTEHEKGSITCDKTETKSSNFIPKQMKQILHCKDY